jgi:hypothetical protein
MVAFDSHGCLSSARKYFARFALTLANATNGGVPCCAGTSHGFAKPLMGKDDSDENQIPFLSRAT